VSLTIHNPEKLRAVVQRAYSKPFSLQSDFAREYAYFVAAAASLGFITTRISPKTDIYGSRWLVTRAGLLFLENET